MSAFKADLWILVDDFTAVVVDGNVAGYDIDTQVVGLKIFYTGRLKVDDVISSIGISCKGNVTGGWVCMKLIGSVVGIVPRIGTYRECIASEIPIAPPIP